MTTQETHIATGMSRFTESGKIGYAILWLLGVPLPLLIIIYLIWRH